MRYLLDTGLAGAFLNARDGVLERVFEAQQRGDVIGICTPVLAELWYGIENSANPEANRRRLLYGFKRLKDWPFDPAAARRFGELAAELRRIGRQMQTFDIQIAAIALELGNCVVVSKDSDLKAVPGLKVEDWSR
ncbi:MAG: tRNA(fMet)-specific endonuclease VapC [Verrucomicrobiales bacterium]|jgi:tRNA(fMet)-specific endonuclease VapC